MARPPRVARGPFAFERMHHPLLPFPAFLVRMLHSLLLASALIGISLAMGMLGYHGFEHLDWLDSYLNAAMLLSGMGPIWSPASDGGKLFAGLYALYSGVAVLAFAGVVLAPLGHRLLHKFHAADDDDGRAPPRSPRAPRTPSTSRKGSQR